MILQSKEHRHELIILKALNLPLLLPVTSFWFHPVPHLPVSAAHSWPSQSLWKLRADFNRSWQEGEMPWILKSFDDNVKLDGKESPVMHPVWEKLQPFLDIARSPWELSLELSWAEVLLVPCLWSWLCPFHLLPRLWLFFPTSVNFLFSSVLCTAWSCLSSNRNENVSAGQTEIRAVKNQTFATQKGQEGEQKQLKYSSTEIFQHWDHQELKRVWYKMIHMHIWRNGCGSVSSLKFE